MVLAAAYWHQQVGAAWLRIGGGIHKVVHRSSYSWWGCHYSAGKLICKPMFSLSISGLAAVQIINHVVCIIISSMIT